ncbi:hypothetical protein [Paraburkholderia diazotrophica]|uniref:hypothetical protein n=1 Tax=Paraburkholderia diazotrophica TaxID=667676 RepID=UPI00317655B2
MKPVLRARDPFALMQRRFDDKALTPPRHRGATNGHVNANACAKCAAWSSQRVRRLRERLRARDRDLECAYRLSSTLFDSSHIA